MKTNVITPTVIPWAAISLLVVASLQAQGGGALWNNRPSSSTPKAVATMDVGEAAPTNPTRSDTAGQPQPIAWNKLGAKATAQYSGDGLAVSATANGARLRCAFQKLEGDATREGLQLRSITAGASNNVFGLTAISVGRQRGQRCALPSTGTVETADGIARFIRPGLIEEYSVSVDGLRQDFILPERVAGQGTLRVELKVSGASAEAASDGARLVLEGSGRTLNYHRLRATDATGRELAAWMEIAGESNIQTPNSDVRLAVMVEEGGAAYPVRIDPTFSDANWTSLGGFAGVGDVRQANSPGFATSVGAVAVDSSGNLYIGGAFGIAGDVFATNIAKWDGNTWSALGSGVSASSDYPSYGGSVNALAVSGTNLYVGGVFTRAGDIAATNVAKWDGSSWSALGSGMNSNVLALAVSGQDLYAGGWFTSAGGTAATNVAKWNGSSWSALGSGIAVLDQWSGVHALAISGTDLFVGGRFIRAGGIAATNIAKWNGSSWSALGSGIRKPGSDGYPSGVRALTISGTDLYVGGVFTTAGGIAATNIAKWNGSSWSSLGVGVNKAVFALAMLSGQLYVGGVFTSASGTPAYAIAKWNGSSWSALGFGIGDSGLRVAGLAVSGTNLYTAGSFPEMGGIGVAKWNGNNWSALGSGAEIGGGVNALAVSGSELYAAGGFTTPGGASHVAKWNGTSWSALGLGVNGPVYALAVSGSDLYVGGVFPMAGGTAAISIAKWNGNSWSALGSGIRSHFEPFFGFGDVYALAVSGTNLYAGGWFDTAGDVAASNVAMWNGSSWQSLGSGANGIVYAMAVMGTNLYAGGWFDTAGGAAANSIAAWNGSSWSTLEAGIRGIDEDPFAEGRVYALTVSGSTLYVGGQFMTAGTIAANNIATWNGSSWNALGLGTGDFFPGVFALALSGSDLYAAGQFTMAGGVAASHIAKWNGSSWSALGSGLGGLSPQVVALAVSGSHLYAAGSFSVAGGKVAGNIAKTRINSVAESLATSSGTALIQFSGVTGYEYDVQRTTSLNPPIIWSTVTASPLSPADDGSFTFNDTNAPAGLAYYRAMQR
jgi:hypothetical protein